MIKQELESLTSLQKKILGLELVMILFCTAVSVYFAFTNEGLLSWLLLLFVLIILVPFFATFAYYKGFKRTSIAVILSIFIPPVHGLLLLLAETPSEGGGIFLVFLLLYSTITSAIVPYLMFAASLILHYYRNKRE